MINKMFDIVLLKLYKCTLKIIQMCFVKRNSNEKIATNQQPRTITQITKGRETLTIELAQNAKKFSPRLQILLHEAISAKYRSNALRHARYWFNQT